MKFYYKSIIIAALVMMTANTAKVSACGYCEPTYNYYLFHLSGDYETDKFHEDIMGRMAKEWSSYTHQTVSVEECEELTEIAVEDFGKTKNPIIKYARNANDAEMMQYLTMLCTYMTIPQWDMDEWDYPSEEELRNSRFRLTRLYNEASRMVSKRLMNRILLLRMRILFRMKDYNRCIELWRSIEPKMDNSVFADMTKDLYAGALKRNGAKELAAEVYAELGDVRSALFCMNSMQSVGCMKAVAKRNPNSAILKFMLDMEMNSIQETYDFMTCKKKVELIMADPDENRRDEIYSLTPNYYSVDLDSKEVITEDKWFDNLTYYAIHEEERSKLYEFVTEMANDAKVENKAMWMCAKAYLNYFGDNGANAIKCIDEAYEMQTNDERTAELCRALRMIIYAKYADLASFEKVILKDFTPMMQHALSEETITATNMLHRVIVHGIMKRYEQEGNGMMALLSRTLVRESLAYPSDEMKFSHMPENIGELNYIISSLSVDELMSLYDYLRDVTKEKDELTEQVKMLFAKSTKISDEDMCDMIGTRLLGMGKWEEAKNYLSQVSLDFINEQSFRGYAVRRDFHKAPWMVRQKVSMEQAYNAPKLTTNKKLDFCDEVIALNEAYAKAKGEKRYELGYKLACMYSQASPESDCWWLTRYEVTRSGINELRSDEFNYLVHSYHILKEIYTKTKNNELKARALFGCLYSPDQQLYSKEYDFDMQKDILILNKNSERMEELKYAKSFFFSNANNGSRARTFTKCDILRQLYKQM